MILGLQTLKKIIAEEVGTMVFSPRGKSLPTEKEANDFYSYLTVEWNVSKRSAYPAFQSFLTTGDIPNRVWNLIWKDLYNGKFSSLETQYGYSGSLPNSKIAVGFRRQMNEKIQDIITALPVAPSPEEPETSDWLNDYHPAYLEPGAYTLPSQADAKKELDAALDRAKQQATVAVAPVAPVAPEVPPAPVARTVPALAQVAAGKRYLSKGMYGPTVGEIQKLLNIKVDNDFGKDTDAAVRSFQKQNGLVVDGKVGTLTLAALKSQPSTSTSGAIASAEAPRPAALEENKTSKIENLIDSIVREAIKKTLT